MIETLRRDGIVRLGPVLSVEQCGEVLSHLNRCHAWNSHVYENTSRSYVFGDHAYCYDPEAVLSAPHLFELFMDHAPLAGTYLDAEPRLYSVNVFTMVRAENRPNISQFHRDHDDTRFVGLFVYLTDVLEPEDGAHEYWLRSQRGGPDSTSVLQVLGPAGTAFMADTYGLHRGISPRKPRTMAWARWCVSERPSSYSVGPVPRSVLGDRFPADPKIQKNIELVVR